jgi:hypothetical protein
MRINQIPLITLFTLSVVFTACSSVYNYSLQENILAKNSYSVQSEQNIYLSNIKIYQSKYDVEKGTLCYDYAQTLPGYSFENNAKRLIHILFDTNTYKQLHRVGNVYFFQIENDLYLVLNKLSKKRIELLYGMDKKSFDVIYNILLEAKENGTNIQDQDLRSFVLKANASGCTHTINWNPKMIIIDGLLKKDGAKPIRRIR